MKIKTIKMDGCFPSDMDDGELAELLSNGWIIINKDLINDRYIVYTLQKREKDDDVGKCCQSNQYINTE
ncbi:unnamed protein product [marine sediment metagenome]|uniref:Uncharacterized protein n=1 Tax=marine sediment metagenome TaxID=412755 RepID=X0UVI2_9ZZZZ